MRGSRAHPGVLSFDRDRKTVARFAGLHKLHRGTHDGERVIQSLLRVEFQDLTGQTEHLDLAESVSQSGPHHVIKRLKAVLFLPFKDAGERFGTIPVLNKGRLELRRVARDHVINVAPCFTLPFLLLLRQDQSPSSPRLVIQQGAVCAQSRFRSAWSRPGSTGYIPSKCVQGGLDDWGIFSARKS